MAKGTCARCNSEIVWFWREAFDKFGFGDGDDEVFTEVVAEVLTKEGYAVESERWGLHNTVITSIKKHGVEQIPSDAHVGYDDPRDFLPEAIVAVLDERLPD